MPTRTSILGASGAGSSLLDPRSPNLGPRAGLAVRSQEVPCLS